jgi:undecaprenyl-diphosphatase
MHLQLWQVIVLAVIQGVTEFLPISSDGHLAIAAALMAGGNSEILDVPDVIVVLHGGTLMSILVFYWRRILELLREDRRTIWLLIAATVPAVGLGLPVELFAKEWLASPTLAGVCLVVTGLVLIVAGYTVPGGRHYKELGLIEAVAIGISQAVAILPGLSRSGCTITAGLRLGLTPTSAATFSFLMAIPVIAGACLVKSITIWKAGGLSTPASHLVIGVLISFVVGFFSLWWLVRWLERGRFALFAVWCIPIGIGVVIWQTLK